jgi:hypothetical protein
MIFDELEFTIVDMGFVDVAGASQDRLVTEATGVVLAGNPLLAVQHSARNSIAGTVTVVVFVVSHLDLDDVAFDVVNEDQGLALFVAHRYAVFIYLPEHAAGGGPKLYLAAVKQQVFSPGFLQRLELNLYTRNHHAANRHLNYTLLWHDYIFGADSLKFPSRPAIL